MSIPSRELLEQYITKLRNGGDSKISSIVKVASHFKIGLNEAKIFVHESSVWSEQKKYHEEFQQTLVDEAESDQPNLGSGGE